MRLLFFLHRATFPSKKSKNKPNGMNASAIQRSLVCFGGLKQYRMENCMLMTPQKPFMRVIRSAR